MTREELTDIVWDALDNSIDQDWTVTVGARYVVDALVAEGVVALSAAGGEK